MPKQPNVIPYSADIHDPELIDHLGSLRYVTGEEMRANPMDEADQMALAALVLRALERDLKAGSPDLYHTCAAILTVIRIAYQLGRRRRHPRDAR